MKKPECRSFTRIFNLFAGVLLLIGSGLILHSCIDNPLSSNGNQEQQDDTGNEEGEPYDSNRNPGASSVDLLTDDRFTHVAVEVDYMSGSTETTDSFEPPAESLESLEAFLAERTHKEEIIIRTPTEIPGKGQETYTREDLEQLEEEHRNHYTDTESDTLHIYLLVVDTHYDGQAVLSTSYYNTSVAFFGTAIDDTCECEGAPPVETVEATLLRHEFGHLMGLVSDESHQDGDGRHCTVEGCLMHKFVDQEHYFVYEFPEDGIPPLEGQCLSDLRDQGGK